MGAGRAQPATSASFTTTSTVREAQRAEMRRIGLESPAPSMGQATSGLRPHTPRRIRAQLIGSASAQTSAAAGSVSNAGPTPCEDAFLVGADGADSQGPSVGAMESAGQPGMRGGQGGRVGQVQKQGGSVDWCHLEDSMDSHDIAPVVKAGPRRVQAQRVLSDDD